MADKYSSVVTNGGASYLLNNNVYSHGKFQVSKIEICDKQIGDITESMGWTSMTEGGCTPVTTIEGTEAVNNVLRKVMIDEYTVQLRVTLGPEIGDRTNPSNALTYGSVGIYLAYYNEDGEIEEGQDVLFLVGSLDSLFNKYMTSNLTAGNTVSFYLQIAVNNRPQIDNIDIKPISYFSIPTVPTEDDEYEKLNPYYNLFGVWDYNGSSTPALVFRDKSGTTWDYYLTALENAARTIAGGGIYSIRSESEDTKLPYWELGATGISVKLPAKTVAAFPDGFNADSTFRTNKQTIELGLSTKEVTGDGAWVVLLIHKDNNFYLQEIKAELLDRNVRQPTEDVYWYDRSKNLTYLINAGVPEPLKFVEVAQFSLVNNKVGYYHPANIISSISQSDYNYMIERMNSADDEAKRIDKSAVHIEGAEQIKGQKTFLRDVVIYSTVDSETTSDLVLKTSLDSSITASTRFVNNSDVKKGELIFGLDGSGNASSELNVLNSTGNKSFIKIDTGSATDLKVVDASDDVKYAITQNFVGYNHKDASGNSKQINVEGLWKFTQNITGQMFIGTAYRSLFGDLAETYIADANYQPGTLVEFGGKYELTISKHNPCGVISTKPGMLLNCDVLDENDGHLVPLALIGRVPVRVIGKINKFDKISYCPISHGVAQRAEFNQSIIGVALESNDSSEEKLVLCSVKIKF